MVVRRTTQEVVACIAFAAATNPFELAGYELDTFRFASGAVDSFRSFGFVEFHVPLWRKKDGRAVPQYVHLSTTESQRLFDGSGGLRWGCFDFSYEDGGAASSCIPPSSRRFDRTSFRSSNSTLLTASSAC